MIAPSDLRTVTGWMSLGPILVGATFLWTGALKAIAPHVFRKHLESLGWIPRTWMSYVVPAAAGLETAWGMVLILGILPAVALPLTALLLAAFTGVSWWGVKSGHTTDCGCYGGYVVPSIVQSVMLNGLFIALVLVARVAGEPAGPVAAWKIILTVLVGIASTILAASALQHLTKTGHMLIKTTPLKLGRRWSKRWGTDIPEDGRDMLISYLGPSCPYCKKWVRVLNVMHKSPGLPGVIGIIAESQDGVETFVQNSGIHFPVVTVPQTLMSRLVWGVPTTVLVSSGVIETKWSGTMPAEFFTRFKEAFFPSGEVAAEPSVEAGTPAH